MNSSTQAAAPPSNLVSGIIRACRPRQWAKNCLVVIAPVAAGALVHRVGGALRIEWHAVGQVVLAFVVFSMVASATYLVNDTLDVEADRRHPTKRNRPIAAGVVPIPLAMGVAVALLAGGLALGLWRSVPFFVVTLVYAVQTTAYSLWLKHQPVLDVVALSGGFILRLLAGAYAVDAAVSDWFFIISLSGALFIAAGKRLAEQREIGDDPDKIRKTLAVYSPNYLRFMQTMAATMVVLSYIQWALDHARVHPDSGVWTLLSILPFLIAILRYALLVDLGKGSAPEELLFADRQLQVVGAVWAVLLALGFILA
jgi:decaprenyl-phosphate phosphoribosyltransferase